MLGAQVEAEGECAPRDGDNTHTHTHNLVASLVLVYGLASYRLHSVCSLVLTLSTFHVLDSLRNTLSLSLFFPNCNEKHVPACEKTIEKTIKVVKAHVELVRNKLVSVHVIVALSLCPI